MSRLGAFLSVTPLRVSDAVRLWLCYGVASLGRPLLGKRFRGMGEFLVGTSPVRVRAQGLIFSLRPRSEDLQYILAGNKRATENWFTPQGGDVVVDVGAHVGAFSLRAAARGAKVISLEPNPSTAKALRTNISLNRLYSISVIEAAAGAVEGSEQLWVPDVWDGRSSLYGWWAKGTDGNLQVHTVEVRIRPIDDLVEITSQGVIDWLLIDVEGHELEVLKGAARTLDKTRRVILEVSSPSRSQCLKILEGEHGFRIRSVEHQTNVTDYVFAERTHTMT